MLRRGEGQILAEDRAHLADVTLDGRAEKMCDQWAEEEPPDVERAIEPFKLSGVALVSASLSSKSTRRPFRLLWSEADLPRAGAESASPGSGPAITSKSVRTSAMVRAIGPTTPSQLRRPAPGGK